MNRIVSSLVAWTVVLATPSLADQYDASGKAYDAECKNFNNILDQADCGIKVVLEWAESKNGGKIPMRIIYDANGHIAAMVDGKGNMLISNPLHRPGDPMAFFRYATPPGQLAACDSAEVMQTLARIAKTPINWVFDPKTLGSNDTKNFCSVTVSKWVSPGRTGRANYTVEWMDRAKGTFWVQIQ